jgi:hypothetical protein
MATQNEGSTLDDMLDAMRNQSIDNDDDSSGDLPEDNDDGRKGPRANRVKWETLVARYETLIAGWTADKSPHALAIVEVLTTLRSEAITGRDAPREERANTGKHYLGVKADGSRVHFQSPSVPTAKGFPSFVKVLGPYNSPIAADYDVKHDTQLSRRTVVYSAAKA